MAADDQLWSGSGPAAGHQLRDRVAAWSRARVVSSYEPDEIESTPRGTCFIAAVLYYPYGHAPVLTHSLALDLPTELGKREAVDPFTLLAPFSRGAGLLVERKPASYGGPHDCRAGPVARHEPFRAEPL